MAPLFVVLILAIPEPIAPPRPPVQLADLRRFTAPWLARENLDFADAHLKWVKGQIALDGPWRGQRWRPWLEEAEELRETWGCLVQAQSQYVSPDLPDDAQPWALEALELLRDRPGVDYDQGRLPAPVPLWRFQAIR